jgi:hypothetical protein
MLNAILESDGNDIFLIRLTMQEMRGRFLSQDLFIINDLQISAAKVQ